MNYDIFISYKRRGSSLAAAPYLFELLRQRGYNVFLDTKEMRSGHFDEQLLKHVSNAKDIIILLEEDSLKSWFDEGGLREQWMARRMRIRQHGDEDLMAEFITDSTAMDQNLSSYNNDWFIKEVMHALSLEGKNIIPLLLNGYRMPESKDLPPELASLPRNQALDVDLSKMENLIQEYFIDKEYLKSKPRNLAISRQYQSKGGIVASFLFYTDACSCELSENGERIITLTDDNDELHPFIYNVGIAGEHRFKIFNNDTCESIIIRKRVEPSCQEFVHVKWKEKQSLWALSDGMIAAEDDPEKLFFWGTSLFNGTVKNAPDLGRALQCLERAVDMDHQPAVDFMKESGGISTDAAGSDVMFRWYTLADRCGSIDGSRKLGAAYYYGRGVEQSFEKAFSLISRAAEHGNIQSIYNLALMYSRGKGVEQSYEKAVELYTKAAEKGNTNAMDNLALMYKNGKGVEKSYEKAVELYTMAVEKGDYRAVNGLAVMYNKGQGVEKSYEKAVELFTKAAENGNTDAMYNLALMYMNGKGVKQSYGKAMELFTKVAEEGDPDAMNNLAAMYRDGKGVEQSYEKALELYRRAMDQQYDTAYNQLAWTYHLMGRYEDAMPWAEKAMKAFPNEPAVIDTMATVLQGLGRHDEAMSKFEECFELYRASKNEKGAKETEEKMQSLMKLMKK